MESKHSSSLALPCILFLMLLSYGSSDISKDREKCANQLVGLATCLPYVGGDAKAPTIDCCTGLKQVLQTSKECLCILVKDRNDPSLGLKINATLALSLPQKCHSPSGVGDCPALLHLPPNSPDAKVFEEYANSTKASNGSSSTTTPSAEVKGNSSNKDSSSANVKNDGGKGRWLRIDIVLGFLIIAAVHVLPCFDV